MVEMLQTHDHKIFNALADPVERYCAELGAADPLPINDKRERAMI